MAAWVEDFNGIQGVWLGSIKIAIPVRPSCCNRFSFATAAARSLPQYPLEVHRTTTDHITEAAGATAVALQTAEAERILRTL